MKYLLILILCSTALADKAPTTIKAAKNQCSYLTIRFPWGSCRASYCGRVKLPSRIKGYACGTYVDCYRNGGNRYLCRY
jgi:hypothetical protein